MKIQNSYNPLIQNQSTQPVKKSEETQKSGRVEEIKEAIKNGNYKIDIESTAKAMAKALL